MESKEPETVFCVADGRDEWTHNLGYRPATVEDITDEMVERVCEVLWAEDGPVHIQRKPDPHRCRVAVRKGLEAVFCGD